MQFGVPIVLGTDDEGVLRSDMSHEFMRAALEQGLDYPALKVLARNSLDFSFLPDTEKTALKSQLEKDFAAFEQWAIGAGF